MTGTPRRGQNVVVRKDEKGIVLRPLGTATIDRRDTFGRHSAGLKKTASETSGKALSVQPAARNVAMRAITIDERTDPFVPAARASGCAGVHPFAIPFIDTVARRA